MILAWAFVGLFGIAATITVAPWIPALHRVPVIGAPRISGELRVDGQEQLVVRLGEVRPRSALLEVGVEVLDRADVEQASINLLIPPGLQGERCDHRGRPQDEGTWMPRSPERLGRFKWIEYWAVGGLTFTRDTTLKWFRLKFSQPGEYPVRLKVNSSQLYREFVKEWVIKVIEPDELGQHDRAGELIDEGEALKLRLERGTSVFESEDTLRVALTGWLMNVKLELPDLDDPGEAAPSDFQLLTETYLDALYELRNRLGRDEDQ
jgi:hypothetical protein